MGKVRRPELRFFLSCSDSDSFSPDLQFHSSHVCFIVKVKDGNREVWKGVMAMERLIDCTR